MLSTIFGRNVAVVLAAALAMAAGTVWPASVAAAHNVSQVELGPEDEFLRSPVAREHYEQAQKHYADGNYAAAAAELEKAHAEEPNTELLYAWAQAERQAGSCRQAEKLYRDFIATNPSDTAKDAAEAHIASCEPSEEEAAAVAAAAAEQEAGSEPAAAGDAPPKQPESDRRPKRDPKSAKQARTGVVLIVVGTAVLAMGVATGSLLLARGGVRDDELADNRQQQEDEMCAGAGMSTFSCMDLVEDEQKLEDQRRGSRIGGGVSLALLGGLGVAGIVVGGIMLGRANKKGKSRNVSVAPTLGGLVVSGRF